jgi:hypothetical protein
MLSVSDGDTGTSIRSRGRPHEQRFITSGADVAICTRLACCLNGDRFRSAEHVNSFAMHRHILADYQQNSSLKCALLSISVVSITLQKIFAIIFSIADFKFKYDWRFHTAVRLDSTFTYIYVGALIVDHMLAANKEKKVTR